MLTQWKKKKKKKLYGFLQLVDCSSLRGVFWKIRSVHMKKRRKNGDLMHSQGSNLVGCRDTVSPAVPYGRGTLQGRCAGSRHSNSTRKTPAEYRGRLDECSWKPQNTDLQAKGTASTPPVRRGGRLARRTSPATTPSATQYCQKSQYSRLSSGSQPPLWKTDCKVTHPPRKQEFF